jgi:hypothetical protein
MCYGARRMNKTTVGVFIAFAGLVVGWLMIQPRHDAPVRPDGAAALDAGVLSSAASSAGSEPGTGGGPPVLALDGGLPEDLELSFDAGFEMPDGGTVPELSDAPKSVRFGVVLIQYAGAEGAGPKTRSPDDAKALADELAAMAKEDWEGAVKKGDPGSAEDAGRMFRNILEPAPEAVLFSLEEGEVSQPVDTPRGLWIVKRLKK